MSYKILLLIGSESDRSTFEHADKYLDWFGLQGDLKVSSAHRNPEQTAALAGSAREHGYCAIICGAGMAAHLAGAVAAQTLRPVIGVPIDAGPLSGFDALLSTAQMPGGIPVATVAIGKAGAKNAGYLAAQIIAVTDDALKAKLIAEREANAQAIRDKNKTLKA